MKKNNNVSGIVSILIIFALVIGVWKGPVIFDDIIKRDNLETSESVEAARVSGKSEMRAVWISYLEFQTAGVNRMSKGQFQKYIDKVFNKCKTLKMNTVIVQVRPYGDAMYKSNYFPWSAVASGKQGRNPGYDPLAYMVQSAHKKGLEIHAWLNPYRVMSNNMKTSYLASANPAKKWMNAKSSTKRRNVLSFDGAKYYNPAKRDVRNLIVNGVKEIVQKYDVDGIHFDDYFYPALGSNYKNNFDAKEYNAYKNACKKNKKNAMSIISWRRNNVNLLLKDVYSSIKKIDKNVSFGVSPAGNINNLYASDRYYCDVKKWMGTTGYVDYICPQVYWSFTNKYCPYTSTVKRWASIKKSANVKLFIGLAAYRAGISKSEARAIGDIGWSKSKQELKKQVVIARKYKKVSGFVFYRYDNMVSSKTKTEIQNLKRVLK